jgi:hypothetical protein
VVDHDLRADRAVGEPVAEALDGEPVTRVAFADHAGLGFAVPVGLADGGPDQSMSRSWRGWPSLSPKCR